jgi:segregation and condensation protein A
LDEFVAMTSSGSLATSLDASVHDGVLANALLDEVLLDVHSSGVPEQIDHLPRLYGEPLLNLPQDLYIPPEALKIFLEAFEGPLDLLLYLIRKQNFNIFDIPMVQVTAQYLVYVEEVRAHNLELAGEYLLMAAMLIEIKSRMLLPVVRHHVDDVPEADPRAELVRRLLEYEKYKAAALTLDGMPQVGRDSQATQVHIEVSTEPVLPSVSMDDLTAAWQQILARAKLYQRHTISRESLSVRDFMTRILRQLNDVKFVEFSGLFSPELGVPMLVVNFIALLELSKEQLIQLVQAAPYAPIYVYTTKHR